MSEEKRLCERCKAEIPLERVEALPDTFLCTKCSKEVGGDYEITIVPENMSKSGSLKKNYGGFSMQKKRRTIRPKAGPEPQE
ncbi:MAG: TraR/DksA C4-type zinc finger protein [Planctomycetes bacterium]|nr:TraR/DksA C4-type zinc finger protein [Planctomycetota bacterium]